MKRFSEVLCAALLFLTGGVALAQTAHYVSLYPTPGTNRYTSVQAAVDASGVGDTVYVEPGVYDGDIVIGDSLVIIGAGWEHLSVDSSSNGLLGYSLLNGNLSTISSARVFQHSIIVNGLTNVEDNSEILGISSQYNGSVNVRTTRGGVFFGCIFNGGGGNPVNYAIQKTNQGITDYLYIANSLFASISTTRPSIRSFSINPSLYKIQSVIIRNCIFGTSPLMYNANVANCIFLGSAAIRSRTYENTTASNCIFIDRAYIPSWNVPNSIWNVTESEVFALVGSNEFKYELTPNSPAIGAGTGGTNCGIYGGATPFVKGGIPPIPWVHQLNVNAAGSQGGGVDVNVKVRAQ